MGDCDHVREPARWLAFGANAAAWAFAALLLALLAWPAHAQTLAPTLPDTTLMLPDTSSKSFDWGASVGFDYVAGDYGAKCVGTLSLTCTTTGTTVFVLPV